jgi:hypothetical protein
MNLFRSRPIICPVCSTGRELPPMQVPRIKLFFFSVSLTGLAFAAAWNFLSPGLASIVAAAVGAMYFVFGEAYYHEKYKRELVCPVCRFDPILYRRAPERAKQRCLDSLKMREDTFLTKWQALKHQKASEG